MYGRTISLLLLQCFLPVGVQLVNRLTALSVCGAFYLLLIRNPILGVYVGLALVELGEERLAEVEVITPARL